MFGFGKVEETRTKINAAADEAAATSKEDRDHINKLHEQINEFANDAREEAKRFERQVDDGVTKLVMAEKIKICLLGIITICAGVVAVNSCRD